MRPSITISVSAGTARSMRRQRRIGSGPPARRAATSISLSSYGMDAAAARTTSGGAPIRIAASSACPAASAFAWYRVRSWEPPRRTRSSRVAHVHGPVEGEVRHARLGLVRQEDAGGDIRRRIPLAVGHEREVSEATLHPLAGLDGPGGGPRARPHDLGPPAAEPAVVRPDQLAEPSAAAVEVGDDREGGAFHPPERGSAGRSPAATAASPRPARTAGPPRGRRPAAPPGLRGARRSPAWGYPFAPRVATAGGDPQHRGHGRGTGDGAVAARSASRPCLRPPRPGVPRVRPGSR